MKQQSAKGGFKKLSTEGFGGGLKVTLYTLLQKISLISIGGQATVSSIGRNGEQGPPLEIYFMLSFIKPQLPLVQLI